MPSLLFPLLFGSILCYLFLRKKKETRNKTSVTFTVFTFLWINSVCLLFFFTFPELLKNGYAYITYPKYEAEIVDIKSQYEWTSTRGSRSRRRMHTPIIAFKPENSTKYLKMPLNISSQEKPSIGCGCQ